MKKRCYVLIIMLMSMNIYTMDQYPSQKHSLLGKYKQLETNRKSLTRRKRKNQHRRNMSYPLQDVTTCSQKETIIDMRENQKSKLKKRKKGCPLWCKIVIPLATITTLALTFNGLTYFFAGKEIQEARQEVKPYLKEFKNIQNDITIFKQQFNDIQHDVSIIRNAANTANHVLQTCTPAKGILLKAGLELLNQCNCSLSEFFKLF